MEFRVDAVVSRQLKQELMEAVMEMLPDHCGADCVQVEVRCWNDAVTFRAYALRDGLMVWNEKVPVDAVPHPDFEDGVYGLASELPDASEDPLQRIITLLREVDKLARENPEISTFVGLSIAALADGLEDHLAEMVREGGS